MRTLLFALVIVCCAIPVAAQEIQKDEEHKQETLFSGDIEHGGYGAPVVKIGSLQKEAAIYVGGYGGWFINHTFMIGGGGYGLVNNIVGSAEAPLSNNRTPSIGFGYGGVVLEYTGNSSSLVHYTIHTLIGAGGAGYYLRNDNSFDIAFDNNNQWDACFAAEIGASLELNVASFFRLGLGGGYLFTNGIDMPGLSDSDVRSVHGHVVFKFGKF